MRKFLNTDETAVFVQRRGETGMMSAAVHGPCNTALEAWRQATDGYDMDHIEHVWRVADGHCEDVRAEIAAAIEADLAERGESGVGYPWWIDRAEVELIADAMTRDFRSMRRQEVA